MNRFLAILLLCFPLALAANETKDNTDPKYLENAITLVDGKVTFQQTLEAPSLSKEELYDLFLNWANERFKPSNEKLEQNRVVYTNPQEGEIAAIAEEYIVFSSSALSLDRTGHVSITSSSSRPKTVVATSPCHASDIGTMKTETEENATTPKNGLPIKWL